MIRERLARLANAALNLLGEFPGGSSVVRSIDQAAARTRHRQLEEELGDANAEIQRLEAAIAELTKKPSPYERGRQLDQLQNELAMHRRARGDPWGRGGSG